MKKVLFLPLLQMHSGHHQVAEAIMDLIDEQTNHITVKKVDLLSYYNKSLEKVITKSYLKCVHKAPKLYDLFYKKSFNNQQQTDHKLKWYQHIFVAKMKKLIKRENPDLIICSHAFPSRILNHLKRKGACDIPVINVYTDFFINSVWGKKHIDYHFVTNKEMVEKLHNKLGIPKQKVFITGIPVHQNITSTPRKKIKKRKFTVLISGGNCGLGKIDQLYEAVKNSLTVDFVILCGDNEKLYEQISDWKLNHVQPMPYISSRIEMNQLYDQVDAIITKPGGVTISEALKKRLPIFIHSVLPGQETINLKYLIDKQLVFVLKPNIPLIQQLSRILTDDIKMNYWNRAMNTYLSDIQIKNPESFINLINLILVQEVTPIKKKVFEQRRFLFKRPSNKVSN